MTARPASSRPGAGFPTLLGLALAAAFGFAWLPSHAATLQLVTDEWIPYEHLSDTAAPGFSTEVLKQVFAAMGQDASFEELPWARAAELVFGGERDAIYTAFYNEERAQFCYFPKEALARDKWVFFIRSAEAGKMRFSSFDDLAGHEIAVLRGASISPEFWESALRLHNVTETASDEIDFHMLEAGRVDFVVASYVNGTRLIASLGLAGKIEPLAARSLAEDDLHVIFSKKRVSQEFVDAFSTALHQFKQTENFQAIYRKYFPSAPFETGR